MNIDDEDLTPVELEIKEKTEVDYGVWPEIIGLILSVLVAFIMFFSADGSY